MGQEAPLGGPTHLPPSVDSATPLRIAQNDKGDYKAMDSATPLRYAQNDDAKFLT